MNIEYLRERLSYWEKFLESIREAAELAEDENVNTYYLQNAVLTVERIVRNRGISLGTCEEFRKAEAEMAAPAVSGNGKE